MYDDSNWKDKLTGFNGTSLTYDAIGNMLKHYTGFTFEWQNGRQLAGATGNGKTISYSYNADGIRTSKTVNGVTTVYTLEGSNVVMETNGTDTLWYYYDASGSLTGFELNGTPYFYVKNAQGDIIAITDVSGIKVVEYTYNAWGKLISTTGSLASTVGSKNPYRYRGYRYDTETGLYYLQSRYYDPAVKRFINADGYASTGQGVVGNNMFAYCVNNPVNGCDPCGTCFHRWDFWNDCEECGGRTFGQKWDFYFTGFNNFQQQKLKLENEVTMQQADLIRDGANAVWDTYVHSVELQVEAQIKQDKDVIALVEYFEENPLVAVDVATGVVGFGIGYIGLFIPLPLSVSVVGVACGAWGLYRVVDSVFRDLSIKEI